MEVLVKIAFITFSTIVLIFFNCHAGEVLKISAPPSIWLQHHENKLRGPIGNLLEEIFKELDITIEYKTLPWVRSIEFMRSGELDMIPVIFFTQDRADFMSFSIPFAAVPTSIFVPTKKTFQFERIEDLKGRKGIMMRGDSISKEFDQLKQELNIFEISDYEQAFRMLGSNRIDYAVAAKYGFLIHAKKMNYENLFEVLPNPIASRNLHFSISNKSKFLKIIPNIDQKIRDVQISGRMDSIIEQAIITAAGK